MEFEDSGLPSDPRIQEAFSYAYAKFKAEVGAKLREFFAAQLGKQQKWLEDSLKAALKEKKLTQEEYDQKKQLAKIQQERLIDRNVEANIQEGFQETIVRTAQEAKASSASLVAIMLLGNFMRSVKDYLEIEGKFGTPVARALADIQHIAIYPDQSQEVLEKADPLTKQTYVINAALQLEDTKLELAEMKEKMKENSPPDAEDEPLYFGDEKVFFNNIKAAYGTDPVLDKRLVDAFNAVGKMMNPSCQMEIGADNKPSFIKDESQSSPKKDSSKSRGNKKGDGLNFDGL